MTFTSGFSTRTRQLRQFLDEVDCVLIGAGAGLSAAAGLDYSGDEFRQVFREWIQHYGIKDLYTSSFYPFQTEEEQWAYWAMHIWFSRYRTGAMELYCRLRDLVKDKEHFIITTNVDGQFEKAGFDSDRIFATQGDYGLFQPRSGFPQKTWSNRDWVEQALPRIQHCRIPSELIPLTPDGLPVSTNLRCDSTFVEDERWHRQCGRYRDYVSQASDRRLLLLEFGVGFNTPAIIRFPFERMAVQFPKTTLVRFNRDCPLPSTEGLEHFITFTEDISRIFSVIS